MNGSPSCLLQLRSLFCTKGLANTFFFFFYSSSTCSPVQEHLSQHLSAASKTSLHKIESFMDQRKDYSSQSWTKRWPTEKFYLAVFSKCPPPMAAWKFLGLCNCKYLLSQLADGKTYKCIGMHEITEVTCKNIHFSCLNVAHLCQR